MAVLPKENIHKMKLKLLLNRLLIFVHFFCVSLRAVHLVSGIQSLVDVHLFKLCRMYLCQNVFGILILCQDKIIGGKKHLTALAADNTSAFSHVFPLGALGCPGVCSPYYFPFQSFILI